jgi:hypothetical protein
VARVQIIYWGDFPAQVQARDNGSNVSLPLPERFQQAIDAAAMKAGATDPDAYLDGWRHGGWAERPGTAQEAAEAVRGEIISAYPPQRLAQLVHAANGQERPD